MALLVQDVDKVATPLTGGQRARLVKITFDASYPTGGEALTAADCGLTTIDEFLAHAAGGRVFEYDYTNAKLLAYQSAGSAAALAQVPDTTDLALVVTRALVIGR